MLGETRNVVGIICLLLEIGLTCLPKNGGQLPWTHSPAISREYKNEFFTFSGRYGKLPWTEGGFTLQTCPRRCRCQHGWASPKCSRYHSYITYALLGRETPRGPENDNFCLLSVLFLHLHTRVQYRPSEMKIVIFGLKVPSSDGLGLIL